MKPHSDGHAEWEPPKQPALRAPAVVPPCDEHRVFLRDVLAGLSRKTKTVPSKYFYDESGSILFDRICELDEYYPTRTELAILRQHAGEMARALGDRVRLVELGSGSSTKTRLLLDALRSPAQYVPVDISREHLEKSARRLARDYPHLDVRPLAADYTRRLELPACDDASARVVAYFPGSTVGNFLPEEARDFLARVSYLVGEGGGLLIGVDLKKDPATLHAAYNDRHGVTAEFNKNLLHRINRELGGDFLPKHYRHYAFYNAPMGRIEMHLVSARRQRVNIAGREIELDEGEAIGTEYSYKYNLREFARLAAQAGFALESVWTDAESLFSVQYFTARCS